MSPGAPPRARGLLGRAGIRTRIAGGSLIIAIMLSVVAGIVINGQIKRIVRDGTVAVLASDSEPYVVAVRNEPAESFDAPGPAQLVAVLDPSRVVRLDTLPAGLAVAVARGDVRSGTSVLSAAGVEHVVRVTPVEGLHGTWTVIAARAAAAEDPVADQLRNLLFGLLGVIDLAVGLTAWLLASASLAPVARLRASAQTLSTASGSELLPVGAANDEIAHLARTLNDLIERLRSSADRERSLVADASHELRTPLAILRTQLELARTQSTSAEELLRDIRGAERSATRLALLVDSLLELSTLESADTARGAASLEELEREAEEAAERARFRASGTAVEVDYRAQLIRPAASVAIGGADFGRLIDNLVSNSLAALGQEGRLEIVLADGPGELTLTVRDTGGGLDPAFEPLAFDRFSRADSARVHRAGAGLGLAIVAAIAARAGGRVRLDNAPGTGLTVTVSLPSRHGGPGPR
ncbi:MAG: hypothetical protein JWR33_841 [Naasia sp.]|uniref:sensor histidine kinase n=1 Tax=Naasia sp. TaxID=2546198 RepID=UPI00261214BC|nr:HAMP domain-containing sensor histidine kinase [Naasia sp.]MCU1570100.1 hypothetical protein [Naasia sp.]